MACQSPNLPEGIWLELQWSLSVFMLSVLDLPLLQVCQAIVWHFSHGPPKLQVCQSIVWLLDDISVMDFPSYKFVSPLYDCWMTFLSWTSQVTSLSVHCMTVGCHFCLGPSKLQVCQSIVRILKLFCNHVKHHYDNRITIRKWIYIQYGWKIAQIYIFFKTNSFSVHSVM